MTKKNIKQKSKKKSKNTFSYNLDKKENEVSYVYDIRKVFIETLKPKNEKEFKLFEMYSNILINMIFLKCRYKTKTEKKIKDYIKNYKKNYLNLIK
jgi:hypothetical protein